MRLMKRNMGRSICISVVAMGFSIQPAFAQDFRYSKGMAISGKNDKSITNVSANVCQTMCMNETSFVCRSVDYTLSTRKCDLSKSTLSTSGGGIKNAAYDHYERVNFSAKAPKKIVETPLVPRAKDFVKHQNYALSGYNDKVLKNVSPDQCMRACAESVNFICRSFDYDKRDKKCDLSHATGPYVSGKSGWATGLSSNSRYDHYENQMEFRRIANAALSGFNDKQLTGVSPQDCLNACTSENSFECRSIDYHIGKATCDLSSARGQFEVDYKVGSMAFLKDQIDKVALKRNKGYDHYIRVRPDYIKVQTPSSIYKMIKGATVNTNYRCKLDPWVFRAADEAENSSTACSDPTGIVKASDKRKFNAACKRHDVCYSSPGPTRLQCDVQFNDDMNQICNDAHNDGSPNWMVCQGAAKTMFTAVGVGGQSSYDGGQKWVKDYQRCIAGPD